MTENIKAKKNELSHHDWFVCRNQDVFWGYFCLMQIYIPDGVSVAYNQMMNT